MRVVGLRYYESQIAKAISSGRLSVGCSLTFRYNPVAADPDAFAAYLDGARIGSMPQFASQVLKAGNWISAVDAQVRVVTGHHKDLTVVVDIVSPFESAPQACSLSTPRSERSGVYAIVNVRSMKAYIGCSQRIDERRREHLHALQCGAHFSPHLQRDWNSRQSAFAFVILKAPPQKALLEAEQYFKYIYDAENPAVGYNQGAGFSPAVGRDRQRQADGQFSQAPERSAGSPSPARTQDTGCLVVLMAVVIPLGCLVAGLIASLS